MMACLRFAACAVGALVLSGCASTPTVPTTVTKEAPASVRTVTVIPTAVVPSADETTADEPTADQTTADLTTPTDVTTQRQPAAAADSWTMPDETGAVLQAAQDRMQALTGDPLFYSASTDASGAGRMQVLDSNWQVCSQTPAAGTKILADTPVSFAAVKLSESCP